MNNEVNKLVESLIHDFEKHESQTPINLWNEGFLQKLNTPIKSNSQNGILFYSLFTVLLAANALLVYSNISVSEEKAKAELLSSSLFVNRIP